MTYTMSSGTLNSTIPYRDLSRTVSEIISVENLQFFPPTRVFCAPATGNLVSALGVKKLESLGYPAEKKV